MIVSYVYKSAHFAPAFVKMCLSSPDMSASCICLLMYVLRVCLSIAFAAVVLLGVLYDGG